MSASAAAAIPVLATLTAALLGCIYTEHNKVIEFEKKIASLEDSNSTLTNTVAKLSDENRLLKQQSQQKPVDPVVSPSREESSDSLVPLALSATTIVLVGSACLAYTWKKFQRKVRILYLNMEESGMGREIRDGIRNEFPFGVDVEEVSSRPDIVLFYVDEGYDADELKNQCEAMKDDFGKDFELFIVSTNHGEFLGLRRLKCVKGVIYMRNEKSTLGNSTYAVSEKGKKAFSQMVGCVTKR